ncbi:hypothetical protein [Kutzneria kofuensis]|uniref:hypothetical protein n=1 Tax=Kutzneria kofuensis TaxID=103725 RepID=UPI0031EDACE6
MSACRISLRTWRKPSVTATTTGTTSTAASLTSTGQLRHRATVCHHGPGLG